MNVLKIVACLLFFSFVWCVGYGDTPLKPKKEEQAKQAPVDGPYVLYDEVGNARVIRVDERGITVTDTPNKTEKQQTSDYF